MNSLPAYLITTSLLLTLFFFGYLLLLRNQKLFVFTRFYLIGSIVLSLLHPLFSGLIPTSKGTANELSVLQTAQYLPTLTFTQESGQATSWNLSLLLVIYIAGCCLMAIVFLRRLIKLRNALKQLHFEATPEGFWLAHLEDQQPSFSFFSYLAINTSHTTTEEEYRLILQHEKAHARQHHSADVLLAEIAQVLLWFHPLVYMLNKALRQTHEHLADAAVLEKSSAESTYISLMARQCLAAAGLSFTSTFFQSFTINRIRMIKKTSMRSTTSWRIAASLVFAASLTAFVACEKQQEMSNEKVPPPPVPSEVSVPPSPGVPDANGVYDIVEEESQPLGGMQSFYEQLSSKLEYPEEAKENSIEGKAFIKFVIDENGNIIDAQAVEGRELGYGLDEAAINAIKSIKWTPAKQDGQAVKQRKILPIRFKL